MLKRPSLSLLSGSRGCTDSCDLTFPSIFFLLTLPGVYVLWLPCLRYPAYMFYESVHTTDRCFSPGLLFSSLILKTSCPLYHRISSVPYRIDERIGEED